jgi:hypothetical protein
MIQRLSEINGGSGEIRTHGGLTPPSVFKTDALDHSATLPNFAFQLLGLRKRFPQVAETINQNPHEYWLAGAMQQLSRPVHSTTLPRFQLNSASIVMCLLPAFASSLRQKQRLQVAQEVKAALGGHHALKVACDQAFGFGLC